MKKKLTGYASIDKPWLKYYTKEEIEKEYPKMTMKNYLYLNNKDNYDKVAIYYYGRKITYGELFDNIEKTKVALKKIGIKQNDVVSIASPFIPEVVYLVYAINALGGIVNLVDPRVPQNKLLNYINGSNSKYCVVISQIFEKYKQIEKDTNIEKNIIISSSDSLPLGLRCISDIKNYKKFNVKEDEKNIKWNNFIANCSNILVEDAPYEENKAAVIVYTSGTSGEPKGAVASNESFNNLGYTQSVSLSHTKKGDKFLLIMPPFIAYGLAVGMHGQLLRSQELIMIPSFSIDNSKKMLGDLVAKYKPQTIMGVPSFMTDLIEHDKIKKIDCRFLKDIVVGGDSMIPSCEERVNNFFIDKLSEARIRKGWGLTEVNSGFSYTKDEENNLIGSVGIPLVGNNIKIVKPVEGDIINFDELEELKYNEVGEIFINASSTILDYLNNYEESKKVFFIDKLGNRWVRTKDLGKITEDGVIFIVGRLKRIIVRPDGHNVSPFAIENIINKHESVESCAVVGTPSTEHEHGSYPTAYIELKQDCRDKKIQILKELKEQIEKELPPRDVAKNYKTIEKMPLTGIGKIDYKSLEDQEKKLTLKK